MSKINVNTWEPNNKGQKGLKHRLVDLALELGSLSDRWFSNAVFR